MSYYVITICPKCNDRNFDFVGGWGFYPDGKTACKKCDHKYNGPAATIAEAENDGPMCWKEGYGKDFGPDLDVRN